MIGRAGEGANDERVVLAKRTSEAFAPSPAISNSPSRSENVNKLGRNDKITIEKNGEKKEVKFKKLDEYTNDGWKVIS